MFKIADIRSLDLSKYSLGKGETWAGNKKLYETLGRLVPLDDFSCDIYYSCDYVIEPNEWFELVHTIKGV